jgi:hypothetical protein
VIDELRTDVTKTRKDGTRGRLRYDYGDHRDPQAAIAWLGKYIDGAKTAGELYGRAVVVIAAEQYASRLVVASSQRMPATRWSRTRTSPPSRSRSSPGRTSPASLTRLEEAVKRAHAAYDKAEAGAREERRAERRRLYRDVIEPGPLMRTEWWPTATQVASPQARMGEGRNPLTMR